MSNELAITIRNLSKTYRIYGSPYGRLLERLPWNKRVHHRPVHALADLNFDVAPGECVGLIGANGAGKSTLLKILSGTSFPCTGSYTIRGRVASLLELGAGFHMEFTGRDNIYLNAAMMGFPRKEIRRRLDEIVEFSELGDFIDAPLRTYSSGMICRLGFSVAVAADPDVLIIDEILSVGDQHFQRKCVDRIFDYKKRGKTLFFCSHSLYDVRQICNRAIWLKDGRVELDDESVLVTNEYSTFQNDLGEHGEEVGEETTIDQPGRDTPRVLASKLIDPETGQDKSVFQSGEAVGVRIHIRNGVVPEPLTVAIMVLHRNRTIMFGNSTEQDGVRIDMPEAVVTFVLPEMTLLSGQFTVMTGVMDERAVHRFHRMPTDQQLVIRNRGKEVGVVRLDRKWIVEPMVRSAQPEGAQPESAQPETGTTA